MRTYLHNYKLKLCSMNSSENQSQETKMFLTEAAQKHCKTTAFWTKFYSILCFIGVGILIVGGIILLLFGSFFNSDTLAAMQTVPGVSSSFTLIGVIYIILGGIMIIPATYLYQFSKRMNDALMVNNIATLELAIEKMKSYWKFIGIYSIIAICVALVAVPLSLIFKIGCMV